MGRLDGVDAEGAFLDLKSALEDVWGSTPAHRFFSIPDLSGESVRVAGDLTGYSLAEALMIGGSATRKKYWIVNGLLLSVPYWWDTSDPYELGLFRLTPPEREEVFGEGAPNEGALGRWMKRRGSFWEDAACARWCPSGAVYVLGSTAQVRQVRAQFVLLHRTQKGGAGAFGAGKDF
jgi:hypothetical protein